MILFYGRLFPALKTERNAGKPRNLRYGKIAFDGRLVEIIFVKVDYKMGQISCQIVSKIDQKALYPKFVLTN